MIDPALARSIKLVGFDGKRLETKRYDIQDGIGMRMLQLAGIRVAIITGRVSESVSLRAKELNVEDLAQDPDGFKITALTRILDKHGIRPEECAFVGDDFPDMPVLRVVGLPVAVGNAVAEVRHECRVHLEKEGGHGAVREFCERLLKARGAWDDAWHRYVAERSVADKSS
jgi:3-deoxy-D-manno-octulosonate 8-phosphate phosphatase (KDO 8-P phosphatase)